MGYDDEIEVEYDTTGVPRPEEGGSLYSIRLTDYLYKKLNSVNNEDVLSGEEDFSENDISKYGLTENDGKINISTTSKLIKYLKSLVYVNVERLNAKLDEKLDVLDYVVDDELKSNSNNPVRNNVLYDKFNEFTSHLNNKSNLNHTHNITEVNSLNSMMGEKVDRSEFNNHVNNKSNPHNVNLSQLGFNDTGWDSAPLTQTSLSASDFPSCRRYGKMVLLRFNVTTYKTFKKNTTVFTLKSQFRPNHTVWGVAYKVGTGDSFTYTLETSGNLKFGTDIANGTSIRIYDCFFTA